MAKYDAKLNDAVSFNVSGGNGSDYSKIVRVSPGGVSKGEAGTKLEEVQDSQLPGTKAVVYYSVTRNGAQIGQSAEFLFEVEAS